MPTRSSTLEPSEGRTVHDPTEERILNVLNQIGHGIEHCNFSSSDGSVSAAEAPEAQRVRPQVPETSRVGSWTP